MEGCRVAPVRVVTDGLFGRFRQSSSKSYRHRRAMVSSPMEVAVRVRLIASQWAALVEERSPRRYLIPLCNGGGRGGTHSRISPLEFLSIVEIGAAVSRPPKELTSCPH